MRNIALALAAVAMTAGTAYAYSTDYFIDRCQSDRTWCAAEISKARRALEQGPRERMRFCIPTGMTDEGLVDEVVYWIGEQWPSWDRKEAAESIAAALVALYSCDRAPKIDTDGD
jgi:hypothetical protein